MLVLIAESEQLARAIVYGSVLIDEIEVAAEEKGLRRWVLLANAKGRYSRGSSKTCLIKTS